jgi:hypothetical protein
MERGLRCEEIARRSRMTLDATYQALSGELVRLSGYVDFGELIKDATDIPATGSPVNHYITEFDVTFTSGQSAVINCEAPDSQEKKRVIVVTAELINPNGDRIPPVLPPSD